MKVLHVAEIVQGGVASYLLETIPAQCAALGIDQVRVLVAEDEVRHLSGLDPAVIRVLPPRRRTAAGLRAMLATARAIIAAEGADILHLHSSFAGALLRGYYLLRPSGRPRIVYCAHGWAFNMQTSAAKRRAYQYVERSLATTTDAIICISGYEFETARHRGLPPALLHCIPNGIAAHPPHVTVAPSPYDPARLNLLYVGRHDRQKGLDILLDAMRRLPPGDIMLHVLGDAVVSQSGPIGDRPDVIHHGWQSRDRVAAFMAGADALVMPSRWEGFGLVAIEAMRVGLPVCASAVDALPELVEEGVSGHLFPPNDAEALATLLGTLDRRGLRAMRDSTKARFLEHFTADRMNRSILEIYDGLCPASRIVVS